MKKNKIIIYGTLLIALLLQILFLIAYKNNSIFFYNPISDSFEYIKLAKEIININFLGTRVYHYSGIFYRYFLAFFVWLFKDYLLYVRLSQAIIGIFNIYLIYKVAKKYTHNEKVAIISLIIAALYGPFYYFNLLILTEVFTVFFVLMAFYFWGKRYFLSGLFFGLAALCKSNIFYISIIIGLFMIILKGSSFYKKSIIKFFSGLFLIILLVTTRNFIVTGKLTLIRKATGITFYMGNNEKATGLYVEPEIFRYFIENQGKEQENIKTKEDVLTLSSYWLNKSENFIKKHPIKWIVLLAKKALFSINYYEFSNVHSYYFFANNIWWPLKYLLNFGIIFPFAIVGLFAYYKKRESLILLAFVALYYLTIIILFINARFRLATASIFIIFAALGINILFECFKNKDRRQLKKYFLVFIAAFLISHIKFVNNSVDYFYEYNNLGKVYLRDNDIANAEKGFLEAQKYNPQSSDIYNNLGLVSMKKGQATRAMTNFRTAIQISPQFYKPYFNLGLLYQNLGEYDTAVLFYKKCLELYPTNYEAYNNVGFIYMQQKKYGRAERYLKKSLQYKPSELAIYNLNMLYAKTGRLGEAFRYYKELVRKNSYFGAGYFYLAQMYVVNKQYRRANQNLLKAYKYLDDGSILKKRLTPVIGRIKQSTDN